ncbi:hypothetical protein BC628DRAFT_1337889 [Trametes gibbosa]|nr:hypothetical protein BC628DRAFT_1337889 [Trametes gibbosa]
MNIAAKPTPIQPLDRSLYSIDDEGLQFMKTQTGIQDTEELKEHVIAVQEEAYAIFPYNCIRKFAFINLKLGRLPAYKQLLTLGKERQGAIFLDIGCCFGNDVRKTVYDGFPIENVVASDLHPEFWELGHRLFKSTPKTFPVTFVPGLLSPEPGSIILGVHGGRHEKGFRTETGLHSATSVARGHPMFCHSPESWTELWDGQIFKKAR